MSNLTEEQYSIMAGFSYLDFTDDEKFEKKYKGEKLGDLSKDLLTIDPTTGQPEFYKYMGDRIIGGRTKEDFKQLLETIAYDNKHDELRNLELKGFANKNSTSGFVGYAFDMNNKKDTFYAIRGSESYPNEGTASTDWVDNFKMGLENYSNQFKDTEEFFLKRSIQYSC